MELSVQRAMSTFTYQSIPCFSGELSARDMPVGAQTSQCPTRPHILCVAAWWEQLLHFRIERWSQLPPNSLFELTETRGDMLRYRVTGPCIPLGV